MGLLPSHSIQISIRVIELIFGYSVNCELSCSTSVKCSSCLGMCEIIIIMMIIIRNTLHDVSGTGNDWYSGLHLD